MRTIIFSSILSVLALSACAQPESSADVAEDTLVNVVQSEAELKRVSKSEFKAFLAGNENAQLVDVRTPAEYQDGAIDGALNMDYNKATFETEINSLDKNAPVLIYCRSGGRSSKALEVFRANGFTHVLELEGGYLNW